MIVAIHQPNYAPWLGYFNKIAASDVFVFLDNAQHSKGSYTNRVQVSDGKDIRWLTIATSFNFGDPINVLRPSRTDWAQKHLNLLKDYYQNCSHYPDVFPEIQDIYGSLSENSLDCANRGMIEALCRRLALQCEFKLASELKIDDSRGEDRLVKIVDTVAPKGIYLSGDGGKNYQNEKSFIAAGIRLQYLCFSHPNYDQSGRDFSPGLSILDALFHLGWENTAALVSR